MAVQARLDETARRALGAEFRGDLIGPGDQGYDAARGVWNGMIDRRPALIARCSGAADVIRAVRFARREGVLASVRGGGHNIAGKAVCDGGLVIDLSRMRGVWVDPHSRVARVQGGALLGDVDHETQAFGLATTLGAVSLTGVAGLTLGGGLGWLMGRFGLSCDNLLSADLVTADGELVRASATGDADLFWGLQGGGGNFGVVTSFEFRLHPVGPMVLAGILAFPIEGARAGLGRYLELTRAAPDELTAYAVLANLPEGGPPALVVLLCYSGDLDEGERVVAPFRRLGPPLLDDVRPRPYLEMQSLLDASNLPGAVNYWKSHFVPRPDEAFLDTVVAHGADRPGPYTTVLFEHLHGAAARIGAAETAFGTRGDSYHVSALSSWFDQQETAEQVAWARRFADAIEPWSSGGVYVNYLSEGEDERVRGAYLGNYERLVALKRRYDPANFFRVNQNVAP